MILGRVRCKENEVKVEYIRICLNTLLFSDKNFTERLLFSSRIGIAIARTILLLTCNMDQQAAWCQYFYECDTTRDMSESGRPKRSTYTYLPLFCRLIVDAFVDNFIDGEIVIAMTEKKAFKGLVIISELLLDNEELTDEGLLLSCAEILTIKKPRFLLLFNPSPSISRFLFNVY
jgi:hypothetical protein